MRYHSRWLYGVLVALLCSMLSPADHAAALSLLDGYSISDEVIVRLYPSVDAQVFAQDTGLNPTPESIEQIGDLPIYRFHIADGDTPRGKAFKLLFNPQVLYAEPNYEGQLPEARQ